MLEIIPKISTVLATIVRKARKKLKNSKLPIDFSYVICYIALILLVLQHNIVYYYLLFL